MTLAVAAKNFFVGIFKRKDGHVLETAPVCNIHLQFHEGFSRFPTFQSRLDGYLGTDMAGFLKVLPTILKATVEFKNDELSSLNLKFNPTVKYSKISMRPIYNFDS